MTHVGCPACRLRFSRAVAAYLTACPECGESPQMIVSPDKAIGFRLFSSEQEASTPPTAVAVSLPNPDSGRGRPGTHAATTGWL